MHLRDVAPHAPSRQTVGAVAGSQVPSPATKPHLASWPQAPLWQTSAAFAPVHGPLPLARPHRLLLASQAPDAQTALPTARVHCPSWSPSLGMAAPAASFGLHVKLPPSQYVPAGQLASAPHDPM